MKEHFIEKFKSRTKDELLAIVQDQENYQSAAVEAAKELLEQFHNVEPQIINTANPAPEPTKKTRSNHQRIAYFRTFSSREIWSSLSAAAAFLAIMWMLREFEVNEIDNWLLIPLVFTLHLLCNVLNHLFYSKEHHRSLPFLAGCFQLGMTTTWIFMFLATRSIILPTVNLTFEESPLIYLIMLVLAFITQAFIEFIKAIFIALKWRTW